MIYVWTPVRSMVGIITSLSYCSYKVRFIHARNGEGAYYMEYMGWKSFFVGYPFLLKTIGLI